MTGLYAGGKDSLLEPWYAGEMAVLVGAGRKDHGRSHFLVKDAAAKGVSTAMEKYTRHGWLSFSLYARNALYCQKDERIKSGTTRECESTNADVRNANGTVKEWETRRIDGISFGDTAAGPNALQINDNSVNKELYYHVTGLKDEETILKYLPMDYYGVRMGKLTPERNSWTGCTDRIHVGSMS